MNIYKSRTISLTYYSTLTARTILTFRQRLQATVTVHL